MRSFLDAIDQQVLVCDGAMGTMLYAHGIFLNRCFDELNLTQPDLVAEVHQEYVRAGADIVETNTFGANRIKLAAFGLAEHARAINLHGARIARHAARDHAFVGGAIGPLGIRVEPWGKTGLDEAEAYFREQAEALVEGGVDLFVLETFRDLSELGAAMRAVRAVSSAPIVSQLTTGDDGHTLDGMPPEEFTRRLEDMGSDVIGVNCSVGPAAMLETIERMASVSRAKLSAQPNAGKPRDVEGRNLYLCSPDYMASYARRFILAGAKLVGGCCGTTPDHIQQIRRAVKALTPAATRRPAATSASASAPSATAGPRRSSESDVGQVTSQGAVAESAIVARSEKSRLANALSRGQFVSTVELTPPRGYRCDSLIEQARCLKIRGIDAVTIRNGPATGVRMSAVAVALLVEQQAGVETVLEYSCRDHSLLGMQSDLLGAHAMGLRNLLLVTGAAVSRGTYPDATAVFDVDSIGLTNVVSRLNHGLDIAAQPIGGPTAFHIGVAAEPRAWLRDQELQRFRLKVEAGAEFVITSPVFDVAELERFLTDIAPMRIPLIVGIHVLTSLREAEFFANEEPGTRVPEALVERMRHADAEGRALAEGIVIAKELADVVRSMADGIQVSPPASDVTAALAIVEGLR